MLGRKSRFALVVCPVHVAKWWFHQGAENELIYVSHFISKIAYKIQPNFQIPFCKNAVKQIVPGESTAEEVSLEWSLHRFSSTDSKVRTTY